MSRLQWKLFTLFMTTMFLPFPFIPRYPMLGLVSAASFLLLMVSTFGWMAVRAIGTKSFADVGPRFSVR